MYLYCYQIHILCKSNLRTFSKGANCHQMRALYTFFSKRTLSLNAHSHPVHCHQIYNLTEVHIIIKLLSQKVHIAIQMHAYSLQVYAVIKYTLSASAHCHQMHAHTQQVHIVIKCMHTVSKSTSSSNACTLSASAHCHQMHAHCQQVHIVIKCMHTVSKCTLSSNACTLSASAHSQQVCTLAVCSLSSLVIALI